MIGTLYAILIVLSAGCLVRLPKDYPLPLKLSLYYAAGTVIISVYMLLLNLLKIKFSMLAISLPFLAYLIYVSPSVFGYIKGLKFRFERIDPLFTAAFILLAATAVTLAVNNVYLPIFRMDAIGGWVFRAKMFFFEKRIPFEMLKNAVFINTSDYPVLVPLNLAWACICAGKWSETAARTFFTLQYLAGLVIFYYFLKERTNKNIAILGSLVVFSIPTLLTNVETGYVDFSISFYILISALFLYEWLSGKERSNLYMSAFYMGAACFTKNDGIAPLLAMLAVLAIHRSFREMAGYALTSAAVFMPYKILTMIYGIKSHMIPSIVTAGNISRLPAVLGHFATELFNNAYCWLYFWIILMVLIFLRRDKLKDPKFFYLSCFLVISLAIYIFIYLMVPPIVLRFAEATANRLLVGLAPAAAFLAFAAVFSGEKA